MKVEITTPEVISTGSTTFTELVPGVYHDKETGETLIVAQDGQTAVTVTP